MRPLGPSPPVPPATRPPGGARASGRRLPRRLPGGDRVKRDHDSPTWAAWPVWKQVTGRDVRGLGESSFSKRTIELRPRTTKSDRVVRSICPYCAVGCGQLVHVQGERITDVEGDPDS